jgi:hypothetical protein
MLLGQVRIGDNMDQKHYALLVGLLTLVIVSACSLFGPVTTRLQPTATEGEVATPYSSLGSDRFSLQPSFLADPKAVCFNHIGALTCLDGNGWHIYTPADFEFPLGLPSLLTQCPDGRTYLLMDYSLFILEGDELRRLDMDTFSTPDKIACGPGNTLWVGHYGGVSRYDGTAWSEYPFADWVSEGISLNTVDSLAVAPDGNVWITSEHVLATFDGFHWSSVEIDPAIWDDPFLRTVAIDPDGNVWVIGGASVLKYDGVQWTNVAGGGVDSFQCGSITGIAVQCLAFDAHNRVWVTTSNGIAAYDQTTNTWSQRFDEDTLNVDWIGALAMDGQGRLWVATNYGIKVFDGNAWSTYRMDTADLYANSAYEIFIQGNGPDLPALMEKAPGSVSGKLVNAESLPYAYKQVEVCLQGVQYLYGGKTPCAHQAYHVVATVAANGDFSFSSIPVGRYHLMIQVDEDTWRDWGEFVVQAGSETDLGEIESAAY